MSNEGRRCLLRARAQPRATSEGIEFGEGSLLLLRVNAPPEKGRANQACVELLAKALGIPKGAVQLVRGERSREKTFAVEGLSQDQAHECLRAAVSRGRGRRRPV